MSEQKDTELSTEISYGEDNTTNEDNSQVPEPKAENGNNAPEHTVNEEPAPSWQAERPNPEQQIPSWQDQQTYPGQPYPEPPYPGQQNPGQTNTPWQNQPPYAGQQSQQPYPGQQNQQTYPGQQNAPWQGQPNPEQQNAPWQNQQTYPGQQNQPPYPGQQIPGQQNQPPYPGQQGQGQPGMSWQNQQFPNIPPTGGGNFYPNQNPNFQNPNMQNQNMQNMQGPNIPNPNLQNTNFQGQQGMGRPPVNPMAATSLVLGIISLLVSCCCFPVGFIVGFVLAMVGLVLAISSKKGKPFSGYAIAGLIVSILGICESLFLFFSYILTVKMMQDPNFSSLMNQIMEQYERSLGPQMISSILRKLL